MVIKTTDNLPSTELQDFPFEIPESWEIEKLGNIIFNLGQKTPNERFFYIDVGLINNKIHKLNSLENILEPDQAPSRARKIVQKNSILYSTVRPYLQNICILEQDFQYEPIASTAFVVMNVFTNFYHKYLFYYLLSPVFTDFVNQEMVGVAYPAINDDKLYNLPIAIPPLNEQKRIVAKIEELLPYIEQYAEKEEKLTALHQQFPEQLKKSILQAAIQGKLTKQDPNDEPALVLIERIKAEKLRLIAEKKLKKPKVVSEIILRDNLPYEIINGEERCIADEVPFEIPENWCWVRLGEIGETNIGLTYAPNDVVLEGTIVLRSGNIQNGKIDVSSDVVRVNLNIPENKKCYKNDLLICARNGSKNLVGKAAIVDKDGYSFGAFMAIFRNQYIYYYLSSPLFRNDFDGINTTTINQITQNNLNNRLIPLPPLNEQKRIVEKIEKLFSTLQNLERN
ncbi:type I restriction-modification system subunit S [Actinobacillus pleuropneumoniae]|uniref:restriction endonuclease subunit S n=1 Tax=Actinobacillus pleuropneumoniae TaxID=715 RepID=UPI0001E4A204|nr:restriction endonuclease subunit S [Actinobacillus pleuropneumoniae]EFM89401.1 Type I restriction-modification system, S subunit [Actinobacillus pleuropneumoniae serovar 4 str. M62]UKH41634.1 restriction endonuclease subunit S [Actinobacillus pleuropneumoniae serovar 4 str. M62]SQF65204.1 type I restriction-modification system subunit S [Actinobacillus pleuropneumoniae]